MLLTIDLLLKNLGTTAVPSSLPLTTAKELVAWATIDTYTRGVPWKEIPHCLGWGCGEKAIRRAFQLEGYGRRIRRRKPPLSEKNQRERLAWAEEQCFGLTSSGIAFAGVMKAGVLQALILDVNGVLD
jgi:hypothetical protein